MKITFIGQAGLLFEKNGFLILIDPYLSNSVEKINPANRRRQPIDARYLQIQPDVLLFTHSHRDHFDPETVSHYLQQTSPITVLCPTDTWVEARKFGGPHNYVEFNRHTEWTQNGIRFTAVKAEHSDRTAIGVLIEDGETVYYITGDTLYNTEIFEDIKQPVDVLFLPINGAGNNMNIQDAERFAAKIRARHTVPLHFGMFDDVLPNGFSAPGTILPDLYKEIRL